MQLSMAPTAAVKARRARLAQRLDGTRALLAAGEPRARNYPAATYPFRASSHFLYLVGLPIPEAMLLVEGEQSTLFVPPHDPADALWHGALPSYAEIGEAVGCAVRPLTELPSLGGADAIATGTIPTVDARGRAAQERALGRPLATRTEADERVIDALIALRRVHDEAAVVGLREAAEATRAAHLAGMKATRPGVREAEVRAAMIHEFSRRDLSAAYGPIVTVHGEILHNDVYHHTLADGDLLLADVGAESSGGWAGDVTRTWPVNGTFSDTQRVMYEIVLAAQEAAIAKVAPGVRYRDVHLAAARALASGLVELGVLRGDPDELVADGVHALFFPHGVGHLIGLDVHDMEDLGDRAGYAPGRSRSEQFGLAYLRLDRDLEAGMAVTIEPGFYQVPAILEDEARVSVAGDRLNRDALARFSDVRGIRIEDDVLVTETGAEVLTRDIPKRAADVEAAVG